MMKNSKPIMLVEDDTVDAMTVKRALKEIKISNGLIHVKNGEEALDHLLDEEKEQPCIVLLDLNMPIMNGVEFLEERAKHDQLITIPVIVLTTSKDEQDKMDSFKKSISGYMVKPVDYNQFVNVIKTIDLYWSLSEMI